MTSKPDADARLIDAHDLALAALREITPASTIGPAAGYLPEEDGSVSLRFENRLAGYPGWYWTVTVARVDDAEPTVLEVELLPGEGALLAPEWVPWAERLAEYRAHQAELAEAAAAADDDPDASDDDLDDDDLGDHDAGIMRSGDVHGVDIDELDEDDDDDDELPSDILHAGDVDGVDIDELDEAAEDPDEEEDADDEDADALDEDAGDIDEEE
ncbi:MULTISPECIES: DUF3027 domain-containing protein [unclassified Microbacterium]|uniref:DUF3027 domain-containing protein n=1 Tax=unclassified Microbacterium TaxID=2609290 RepID=UPI0030183374